MPSPRKSWNKNPPKKSPAPARLDALIEEALTDAYGDAEQASGFCCVIDDNVKFPFKTILPGMPVSVTGVDTDAYGEDLVAIVRRGKHTQSVPLASLPLPAPLPDGGEWLWHSRNGARKAVATGLGMMKTIPTMRNSRTKNERIPILRICRG